MLQLTPAKVETEHAPVPGKKPTKDGVMRLPSVRHMRACATERRASRRTVIGNDLDLALALHAVQR